MGNPGRAACVIGDANCINLCPQRNGAQDIHFILQGRIGAALRNFRHHSASHGTVQKCAVPAAMDCPHGIAMIKQWCATKHDAPVSDSIESIIQNFTDGWRRMLAVQNTLHKRHASDVEHLSEGHQIVKTLGVIHGRSSYFCPS